MAQSAVSRFTEEQVESLSRSRGEPGWLKEYRLEALPKLLVASSGDLTPLQEVRGRLRLRPGAVPRIGPSEESVDLRKHFEGYLTGKETNIILQGNSTTVHVDLDEDIREERGGGASSMPRGDLEARSLSSRAPREASRRPLEGEVSPPSTPPSSTLGSSSASRGTWPPLLPQADARDPRPLSA